MFTSALISVLAQEAAPAPVSAAHAQASFYNLFILVVTLGIFVTIAIAYKRGHKEADEANAASSPTPAPSPSAKEVVSDSDNPALIAVLAAAAYTILGQNVRIVSVQPASPEWSAQGRCDIFQSHKIR